MRIAAAVLLVLAIPVSISAQVRISGVVRDSGGKVIQWRIAEAAVTEWGTARRGSARDAGWNGGVEWS